MQAQPRGAERRQHPRKDLLTKVEYSCEGGRYFGRTVDVSQGGMCLESFFPHHVGQQVALLFRIFEGREPVIVRGEILWIREVGKPASPMQVLRKRHLGIQFNDIEEAMAKTLHQYLVDEVLFR